MADPITYSVSYSFSGYQAISPADPLPGTSIDAELAAVETSIASIITALAEVRRTDGNLQNGIVSWDGLDADVQNRIAGSDTRVTVADLNPSAFASQAEAEAGVANDSIMTPLRHKQALDSLRAFASQSAAEAGTETDTVLSPARGKDAIDAQRPYASQAEAEAGTENTKVMTALRTKQAIDEFRPALTTTATLTFGTMTAGASVTQTVTLTGAAVNDAVVLGLPAAGPDAGVIAQAWVSSTNNVTIRLTNTTGGSITPTASEAYRVTAIRF